MTVLNTIFKASKIKNLSVEPKTGDAFRRVLTERGFETAIQQITKWPGYKPTPLYRLPNLAAALNLHGISYKDEGPRFGLGSFKALGGAYAGLRILQRELVNRLGRNVEMDAIVRGGLAQEVAPLKLVSATDGNHGRSLAWGASMFGAQCRVYIHKDVSEGREKAMRDLGATVIKVDGDYDESVRVTRQDANANGWFVVSDTSWDGYTEPPRDVMSGYGVMTREITEQMPTPPSHVFLQGGVGGMAASVIAYLRQTWGDDGPRVAIVEPDLAACLYESAKTGQAAAIDIEQETVMAGLSCGVPSNLAWGILDEEVSDFITIPDAMVAPTMRLLAYPEHGDPAIEAGESAVAGMAALITAANDPALRDALSLTEGSEVLLIGSEGITDPETYQRIMAGAGR